MKDLFIESAFNHVTPSESIPKEHRVRSTIVQGDCGDGDDSRLPDYKVLPRVHRPRALKGLRVIGNLGD